jgi:hypothetical protein
MPQTTATHHGWTGRVVVLGFMNFSFEVGGDERRAQPL